jgi:hypothetical protein
MFHNEELILDYKNQLYELFKGYNSEEFMEVTIDSQIGCDITIFYQ